MRLCQQVMPISPSVLRYSCEVLWEPEASARLQSLTGFEDLWVGFHARHQCWAFGVLGDVSIHETVSGISTPVEHRRMVVHQSNWTDRNTNEPLPYDEARMAKAWEGVREKTEEAWERVIAAQTEHAKRLRFDSDRAERRYIYRQAKKQIGAEFDRLCGYTGVLKKPERTLYVGG